MKLNGARIVWESLVREGVTTTFGISGGKVIHLFHALTEYPIHNVLTRHEQGAAHAADGYARATGKVGVCLATSGPGATNLVTGLATAYMDSSPVVAITGQVATVEIGRDSFQETDITGITLPITKHNYLVTDVGDLATVIKEAFHIARTGRPGPVLIDIPSNVQAAEVEYVYPDSVSFPGYRPTIRGNQRQIRMAATLIQEAQRPLIIAGHGVTIANAEIDLLELATKSEIPVATTLLGKSCMPEDHPLALGMIGMHGHPYANQAVQNADVMVVVGMRFSDRDTGAIATFAPHAKVIHIDIDPAEIGKNVHVDVPVVGDAKHVLQELNELLGAQKHAAWLDQLAGWRQDAAGHDILSHGLDVLLPQFVIRALSEETKGEALIVSDVGQNQMWEAQYYVHRRNNTLLTSGGLGTMGFALPAAIGAQMGRPEDTTWVVAGDGGFQMNIQELATVVQEGLPIKIAILNNGYLGMVRQWQQFFFEGRYSGTPLSGPDFVKVAEAYGIVGRRVETKQDAVTAIRWALEHQGPALLDFRVVQEENVYPMVKPGDSISQMIRRPKPIPAPEGEEKS